MTLSILCSLVILGIQQNDTDQTSIKRRYSECRDYVNVMLSVVMLSVIILSVFVLSVIMPSVILLCVIMLSVIMLNVIILSVVAPDKDKEKSFTTLSPGSGISGKRIF
jgi:hypothetical protein